MHYTNIVALATLHRQPGITHRILHRMLERALVPKDVLASTDESLWVSLGVRKQYHAHLCQDLTKEMSATEALLERHGIHILFPSQQSSLHTLTRINDAPALLYCSRPSVECAAPVAIVGSRIMSSYGKQLTTQITQVLVQLGHTIVSGFAYGVDQCAHHTTLQHNGTSIGIIGSGLDHFLAKDPDRQHIYISDFPLGTPASRHTFPYRNRLISGLSQAVVLIEARERSGTLTTAHYALKQGKNLWIPPGNMFSEHMKGGHLLLQQGHGNLLLHPLEVHQALQQQRPLSALQQRLLALLAEYPTVESLLPMTDMGLPALRSQLADLEYQGHIQQEYPGKYTISSRRLALGDQIENIQSK